jgi:hypothetical protein
VRLPFRGHAEAKFRGSLSMIARTLSTRGVRMMTD